MNDQDYNQDAQFLWLAGEARMCCLTVEQCPRCKSKAKLGMLNVPVFVSNPVAFGPYTMLTTGIRTEICVHCRACKLRGGQRDRSYEAILAWNSMAKSVRSFDEQIARLMPTRGALR